MMTTESKRDPRSRGTGPLLGAALAGLVLGLLVALLGAVVAGSPAALGALVGTALVVGIFAFGSFTVNAVAGVLPSASLLVALLTYTLQVVAMGLAFVALSGSGLLDEALDRRWLGGTVIGGTVLWVLAQVVLTTRLRIPAFEGSQEPVLTAPADRTEAGAR